MCDLLGTAPAIFPRSGGSDLEFWKRPSGSIVHPPTRTCSKPANSVHGTSFRCSSTTPRATAVKWFLAHLMRHCSLRSDCCEKPRLYTGSFSITSHKEVIMTAERRKKRTRLEVTRGIRARTTRTETVRLLAHWRHHMANSQRRLRNYTNAFRAYLPGGDAPPMGAFVLTP